MKQELYARIGTGQQTRSHRDDDEQHEERGHEQVRHLLYAVAHTMHHHRVGEQQERQGAEDGLHGIGAELLEIGHHILLVAHQLSCYRGIQILQAPSRHHGIEAKNYG